MIEIQRDGKTYLIDAVSHTVIEKDDNSGSQLFASNCASCHGPAGKGKPDIGSRDLTNAAFQQSISDEHLASVVREGAAGGKMPAFGGTLSSTQIESLTAYVRSLNQPGIAVAETRRVIYQPGDDVLFSLPTGRPVDKNAVIVNFAHRFAYDTTFTGPGRGGELFGLDNFALSSLESATA